MGGHLSTRFGRVNHRRVAVSAASLAILVVSLLPLTTVHAGTPVRKETFTDRTLDEGVGESVAMSGDGRFALVSGTVRNTTVGGVVVFARTGSAWRRQAELKASDGRSFDAFGDSVALDEHGDTAIIGARGPGFPTVDSAGAAYIFGRTGTTWTQRVELRAPDATLGDLFGASVAIRGGVAVVGAPSHHRSAGSAYIFTASGSVWSQQAELIPNDSRAGDNFGFSVALSGPNNVLIGAPHKNHFAGAVYLFRHSGSTWTQQPLLSATDAASGDHFGYSVAFGGGRSAIIGAPGKANSTGAAYVFSNNTSTWAQLGELKPSGSARFASFGTSVALDEDGDTALVGVPFTFNVGDEAAALFASAGAIWTQRAELTDSNPLSYDLFGNSVTMDFVGRTFVVGAPNAHFGFGAAFLFAGSVGPESGGSAAPAADSAVLRGV